MTEDGGQRLLNLELGMRKIRKGARRRAEGC
jgi:hypothetical protein